jgi:predicted site-specific integrase-resolvase
MRFDDNTSIRNEHKKGGEGHMTPKQLASDLGVDPKALRRYLRANHTRKDEAKGTNWDLNAQTVKAARAHFAKGKTKPAVKKA